MSDATKWHDVEDGYCKTCQAEFEPGVCAPAMQQPPMEKLTEQEILCLSFDLNELYEQNGGFYPLCTDFAKQLAPRIERILSARLAPLEARLKVAEANNNLTLCVYCGFQQPKGKDWDETRQNMAAHIVDCEKHPLREMSLKLAQAARDKQAAVAAALEQAAQLVDKQFRATLSDALRVAELAEDTSRKVVAQNGLNRLDVLLSDIRAIATPAQRDALAEMLTELSFKWQKALCGVFGMEVLCQENIEDVAKFCTERLKAHDAELVKPLVEALRVYGEHRPNCSRDDGDPCDCGLKEVLARYAAHWKEGGG